MNRPRELCLERGNSRGKRERVDNETDKYIEEIGLITLFLLSLSAALTIELCRFNRVLSELEPDRVAHRLDTKMGDIVNNK